LQALQIIVDCRFQRRVSDWRAEAASQDLGLKLNCLPPGFLFRRSPKRLTVLFAIQLKIGVPISPALENADDIADKFKCLFQFSLSNRRKAPG
jgi:hypothetical protein